MIKIGRYSFAPDRTDYSGSYVIRQEGHSGFTVVQLSGEVLIQKDNDQWSYEIPAYDLDLTFHRVIRFLDMYQLQKKELFPEREGVTGDYPPNNAILFEDYERENVFAVWGRYIWNMDKASGDALGFERARFIEREEFVKKLFEIDVDIALLTREDI